MPPLVCDQTLETVPDPGRVFTAAGAGDTDRFLEMNRQRSLDDGFMQQCLTRHLTLWQPQWRPRVTGQ